MVWLVDYKYKSFTKSILVELHGIQKKRTMNGNKIKDTAIDISCLKYFKIQIK